VRWIISILTAADYDNNIDFNIPAPIGSGLFRRKEILMNTAAITEEKHSWEDVPEHFQHHIAWLFCSRLKSDMDTVSRILELARPKVVVAATFWRIDPEDGQLLTKLLATYI
jgi:hypothetical protein